MRADSGKRLGMKALFQFTFSGSHFPYISACFLCVFALHVFAARLICRLVFSDAASPVFFSVLPLCLCVSVVLSCGDVLVVLSCGAVLS